MEKEKRINHLGVIIDGNRRWAKERKLPTFKGHKKGAERVKDLIKWAVKKKVKILTVYVFSTENWKRSEKEVGYLMELCRKTFEDSLKFAKENFLKVRVAGERDMIPKDIKKMIDRVEKETENNNKMIVNFAFSYGGRKEIIQAVNKIIEKGVDSVNEKILAENLYIPEDLDLIIRTGREKRVSNFLIWQLAYSEFYFLDKYWPAFTENDLDEAFNDYYNRQRRFGQ